MKLSHIQLSDILLHWNCHCNEMHDSIIDAANWIADHRSCQLHRQDRNFNKRRRWPTHSLLDRTKWSQQRVRSRGEVKYAGSRWRHIRRLVFRGAHLSRRPKGRTRRGGTARESPSYAHAMAARATACPASASFTRGTRATLLAFTRATGAFPFNWVADSKCFCFVDFGERGESAQLKGNRTARTQRPPTRSLLRSSISRDLYNTSRNYSFLRLRTITVFDNGVVGLYSIILKADIFNCIMSKLNVQCVEYVPLGLPFWSG